jgi:hypothetical protein
MPSLIGDPVQLRASPGRPAPPATAATACRQKHPGRSSSTNPAYDSVPPEHRLSSTGCCEAAGRGCGIGRSKVQDPGEQATARSRFRVDDAVERRIRPGFHVLVIPYRNPVLCAKMLATLDVLTKGSPRAWRGCGLDGRGIRSAPGRLRHGWIPLPGVSPRSVSWVAALVRSTIPVQSARFLSGHPVAPRRSIHRIQNCTAGVPEGTWRVADCLLARDPLACPPMLLKTPGWETSLRRGLPATCGGTGLAASRA